MDISADGIAGLKLLGSSNTISDECFTKLLEAAICAITDGQKIPNVSQLCNSKGDVVKEAYAALLCLLVESARHDADPDALSVTLHQDYNFTAIRNEKLVKAYRQYKNKLQATLSHIGIHPPHIVDATWTLDYCVKASSLEQVGSFLYLIQLHTESCTQKLADSGNGSTVNKVRFLCTQEELQDLVWKLRDAVRHVEKIAST